MWGRADMPSALPRVATTEAASALWGNKNAREVYPPFANVRRSTGSKRGLEMSTQNVNQGHLFLDWLPMWILARVASSNWLKWLQTG